VKARIEREQAQYDMDTAVLKSRYAQGLLTEGEYKIQLLSLEENFLKTKLKMLEDAGMQETAEYKELQTQLYETQKATNEARKAELMKFTNDVANVSKQSLELAVGFVNAEKDEALARSKERYEGKKADLEAELKALTDAGQSESARAKEIKEELKNTEANYQTETQKIKREAMEQQKKLQVAMVLIDLGREIAGYFAAPQSTLTFGVLGAVQAALATARAVLQIRQINSQQYAHGGVLGGGEGKLVRYAMGGFLANGASHREGGIRLFDAKSGTFLPEEIEGNEAVISADVVRQYPDTINMLLRANPRYEGAGIRRNEMGTERLDARNEPLTNTNYNKNTSGGNDGYAEQNRLLLEQNELLKMIYNKKNTINFGFEELDELEKLQNEKSTLVDRNTI